MEKFAPILIFTIIMIVSLMRAVKEAQRVREQQERQLSEQEEGSPEGREGVPPRGVIREEEKRPPEIPESLTEAREILRKVMHPEEAPAPEEPATLPEREKPLFAEAAVPEEEKIFDEAVAVSISEELTREGELPLEPVLSVSRRSEPKEKVRFSFRAADVVKGIIYHEVLGTPLGLRNPPGKSDM